MNEEAQIHLNNFAIILDPGMTRERERERERERVKDTMSVCQGSEENG